MLSAITDLLQAIGFFDFVKLAVVGLVFEWLRLHMHEGLHRLSGFFFITAHFEDTDESYVWLTSYLAKRDTMRREASNVQVSARSLMLNSFNFMFQGGPFDQGNSSFNNERDVNYLPTLGYRYSDRYKGYRMAFVRVNRNMQSYGGKTAEAIQVRFCTRDRSVLSDFMADIKQEFMDAKKDGINIYTVCTMTREWTMSARRQKRSVDSLVLDPSLKSAIMQDARDFLARKPWYVKLGIPFRRGYLLHGAPGSGKTSLVHVLASELGLDIFIISLGQSFLDDGTLNNLMCSLPERCIALIEDIDVAESRGLTADPPSPMKPEAEGEGERRGRRPSDKGPSDRNAGSKLGPSVSLSGLLNALDGVGAQEGRIFIATTNRYDALDAALLRQGRMDRHYLFTNATRDQARDLFKLFYADSPQSSLAHDGHDSASDESWSSSRASSSASTVVEKAVDLRAQEDLPVKLQDLHNTQDIEHLAADFADNIPQRALAMAALQGYLIMHKDSPYDAVQNVTQWVEDQARLTE